MTSAQRHSSTAFLCRVCAVNQPEMCSIFSELAEGTIVASVIVECTNVQIQEDDGLPEWICADCVGDVQFVHSFIGKTRQSDRCLREMVDREIKEEDQQLYSLEISVLGHPEEVDLTVDTVDEKIGIVREPLEIDDSGSNVDLNNEDESDDLPEDKSDSDEEYQPKRVRKSRANKNGILMPEDTETEWVDSLDDIEKETFTTIDVGDKFICCSCYTLFDSQQELKSHGKTHEGRKVKNGKKHHACKFCYRRYATMATLRAHYKKVKSITKVFDCKLCHMRFVSSVKRRMHAHKHPPLVPESSFLVAPIPPEVLNESGKICCAQGCTQVYETEEELLSHAINAHKANKVQAALTTQHRPIECRICFRRFTDEKGLKAHQQRVYMPKKHVCSICGLKFAQPGECKRHEKDHEIVDCKFKCDQCSKMYLNAELLKAHKKRHSATREFTCNICGQSYLQKQNLIGHMMMHEGKRPFECEICKKGFRMKAKLMYHQRVHSGERPFPCRYCSMAFADSTNRLRHEMSHTGIKPYKCDFCAKTFITKRLKKEHENTHLKRKGFQPPEGDT